MKPTLFFAVLLVVGASAQFMNGGDDDVTVTVQIVEPQTQTDGFESFSAFQSQEDFAPQPEEIFPRLLNHLFQAFEDDAPQAAPVIPDFSQSFDDQPTLIASEPIVQFDDSPQPTFSRIFQRMSDIFNAFRSAAGSQPILEMEPTVSKPMKRGGCSLMQACSAEVDALCGSAMRSALAQAIPRCLQRHRDQLGETCGAYIDRRFAGEEDATSEESSSESSESTATVREQPQPAEESTSSDSASACRAAASLLCSEIDSNDRVAVMACLNEHQAEVPSDCLDTVKDTAAFQCAPDALRFCAGMKGRRQIGRCLKPHFHELSSGCVAAAKRLFAQNTPKTEEFVQLPQPQTVPLPAAAPAKINHNASVYIGLGLAGFVGLVVVAAVIVRRRRRQTSVKVSAVQLVNPSIHAVAQPTVQPTAGPAFVPTAEEML